MKRVIYSLHIDLDHDKLDKQLGPYWSWEPEDRSTKTKRVFNEYGDRLIENKSSYAKLHGCDYFHFTRDKNYDEFRDRLESMCSEMEEYHIVNFYKLWLLEKLADDYDEVLYVDFDVLFETDENFFDENDLSKGIHIHLQDYHDEAMERIKKGERLHLRSMLNKYFIAHALCMNDGINPRVPVANTGIIGGSKKHIKQLNYFEDIETVLNNITFFKTDPDSMYLDKVKETMDYNNEPIFSYMLAKNNVPAIDITGPWHQILNHLIITKEQYLALDRKMTHFISKQFEWHYDKD